MFLLIFAYGLDLALGDPRWLPHPVRLIGRLIQFLDDKFRPSGIMLVDRIYGVFLALGVVGASSFLFFLIMRLSYKAHPLLGNIVWVYLAYTTIAVKDLMVHVKAVSGALSKGNTEESRKRLSMIVGRQTRGLNEGEIVKASCESVAESANDGIIAPLFYLVIGGPAAAIAYKAINTLDSMVGHKDERYLNFGWFSARLDDIANFIPARLTGLLIAVSSFILGQDGKNSLMIMIRDGRNHPSPNSGISEAAMAGALGLKLGGRRFYDGQMLEYPYIGEDGAAPDVSLIDKALKICFLSSLIMVVSGSIILNLRR